MTEASDQFVALAKGSHLTGHPPRQNDAAAKPLIDQLLDVSEVRQSSGAYKMADFNNLNAWNRAVLKVGLVYVLAGSGVDDLSKLGDDRQTLELVDRNTAAFAPEMGRYLDAQTWLMIGLMDILNGYLPTAPQSQLDNPSFKNAIASVRSGHTQEIDGTITTFFIADLSDSWRRERLPALAAAGPRAAKFLLPEQTAALRAKTIKLAATMKDPTVKAGLASFADALKPR